MTNQSTYITVEDLPMDYCSGETIVTEDFLRDLFNEVNGVVVLNVVIRNREGRDGLPYAYAFVEFQTNEMAEKAINELNYIKLDNVPIRLSLTDPETEKIRKSDVGILVIRNLHTEIEVYQLHDAFANFGEVISCKIPSDYNPNDNTCCSRGYGFVQFRNPKDAEQACIDLKDAAINGLCVSIKPYNRFSNNFDEINLLKQVQDLFSDFEELKNSKKSENASNDVKKDDNQPISTKKKRKALSKNVLEHINFLNARLKDIRELSDEQIDHLYEDQEFFNSFINKQINK